MKLNGCPVSDSTEAPFVMSQLLSKLESQDNVEFGREMNRSKKEENVSNLIEWLNNEATLRSRGKPTAECKSESHASEASSEDDECPLGCASKPLLPACPHYQAASVDEKWEIVKQNKRCRKCLKSHHTNNCFKPDGTTCNKCDRRHHRSLHNDSYTPKPRNHSSSPMNPEAPPFTSHSTHTSSNHVHRNASKLPGICPVQKVKIKDEQGNQTEVVAMIDSGSNTSFISKSVAKKLGIKGRETHLTMNLAGGKRRSESSELVNITIVSPLDESIEKPVSVYTISTPCSPAKTVSKQAVNNCAHLRTISNKLHLSGGKVDLLIGTDIADAFVDIHVLRGNTREPIAKRNCFGWYLLGQIEDENACTGINSVEVGTVSVLEDMRSLLVQDQLGVRPTELCTCTDNALKETKFIKSITGSTEMVDGRVQVRMPWKVTGPPKRSNYEIALKRMVSSEKTFQRKNCFDVIQNEINKLLEHDFIVEIPTTQVNHDEPEWYLPLQAVFTPDRTTQVRLVFDASAKGYDGQSLNEHLEKGPNYINSLPNVFQAWRWDEVAYCGDIRKMFNQVLIHPDDQIFHRFLWRNNTSDPPRIFQWVRLNFGDKPAPDIATGAINTLARAAQPEYTEGAQELLTHTYVDDIGGSKRNASEVQKVTQEIDAILETGKFRVKAWHSNARSIDQSISL